MPRLGGFSRAVMGLCISCLEDNYKSGKNVSGGGQRLHRFYIALSFSGVSSSFWCLITKCLSPSVLRNPAKEDEGCKAFWDTAWKSYMLR